MDKKDIEKIIVDSLFISERKSGNTLVDIPGMRGWSSPFDEPYANRISLIDGADVEHAIQGAIGFFKSKNSGFTWVVRPADIDAQIPEKLLLNGFVPSKFHKVAGMCLKSFIASPEKNSVIRVQEITGDEIVANIEIISRAYGNTSQEYTRYLYTPSADQDGVVSRMYLAYLQDTDEPIGYGYCSYIENNSVLMLRGAAVVPEHRGKGAYKELLRQRLSDASAEGIEKFIIQSARDSSYSACLRFGFKEICPLELYQWSPS